MKILLYIAILIAAASVLLGCHQEIAAGPTKAEFAAERDRLVRESVLAAEASRRSSASEGADRDTSSNAEFLGSDAANYRYVSAGRRDPFRSILFEMKRAEEAAPRAPLEQFDLSQISVLAVIWDAVKPRALITDPGGRSFVIQKGSRVGKNSGQVVEIGDDGILVRETYTNYAGERTVKDIAMRIRGNQGG